MNARSAETMWLARAELGLWLIVAGLLRWALSQCFDGYWGQDSWGYLDQAKGLLELPRGIAPEEAFWPQGYPALLALGHSAGLELTTSGQCISLLAGAMTPALLFGALDQGGRGDRVAARVAALLVTVSPVHLLWSACATSDVLAAFWLTAAAYALTSPRRSTSLLVVAGVCFGMALWTRTISGLALLGLAPAFLLGRGARSTRLKAALVFALSASVVMLPQWILWPSRHASLAHPWLLGWRPWHLWAREFETVEGRFVFPWPQGVFAVFSPVHPGYLGPVAAIAASIAVWRRRGDGGAQSLLWAPWALGVTLFLGGIPFQNFRFGLISLVPWAALAGLGYAWMWRLSSRWRAAVVASLLLGGAIQLPWARSLLSDHVELATQRRAAAVHVSKLLPREADLYAFGLTADLAHRGRRPVIELAGLSPSDLARVWRPDGISFVLFDPKHVDSQWRPSGTGPVPAIDWLREQGVWETVERQGRWHLWRVQPKPQRGITP